MENQSPTITKNEFLRQFEIQTELGLLSLEYQEQGRQVFLTRLDLPPHFEDQELIDSFIKEILDGFDDSRVSVMPTSAEVAKFFRKNRRQYKDLLPAGISI